MAQTDLAVALVLVNLTDVKKKIENHAEKCPAQSVSRIAKGNFYLIEETSSSF